MSLLPLAFSFRLEETTVKDVIVCAPTQDEALAIMREHHARGLLTLYPGRRSVAVLDERDTVIEQLPCL